MTATAAVITSHPIHPPKPGVKTSLGRLVIYGLLGAMASVALLLNLVLLMAALSVLQATLTLPGIAGIVLTIGMAVDANVLIFERMREEIYNGRGPVTAVDAPSSAETSLTADVAGTYQPGQEWTGSGTTTVSSGGSTFTLRETVRGILRAKKYLADVASRGSLVLFVGTDSVISLMTVFRMRYSWVDPKASIFFVPLTTQAPCWG